MEIIQSYITLIIGWFLGISSTLLVEKIKKHFQRKEVKRGIISEIKDLKMRLIGLCFITKINSDLVTKEWTNWIKSFYTDLILSNEFNYIMDTKEMKTNISNMSESDFYGFVQQAQAVAK